MRPAARFSSGHAVTVETERRCSLLIFERVDPEYVRPLVAPNTRIVLLTATESEQSIVEHLAAAGLTGIIKSRFTHSH